MKRVFCVLLCVLLLAAPLAGCKSEHSQIEGILRSFSGNIIELQTTKGETLLFSLTEALINTTDGMIAGDNITVFYDGAINGADTSGATVVSVEDKSLGDHDLPDNVMSGSLVSFTLNTVTITDAFGVNYTFTTTMANLDLTNGLAAGNYIEVYYKGNIRDGDTSSVLVYKVVDRASNGASSQSLDPNAAPAPSATPTATPQPTATPTPANGSLPIYSADPAKQPNFGFAFHNIDSQEVWATSAINIYVGPGTNYARITGLQVAEKTIRTGYSDNGWSRIWLDGYTAYCLSDYLTGVAPTPTPAPAPTPKPTPTPEPIKTIGGYVSAATGMSTLVLDVPGQGSFSFYPDNAELHFVDGCCIGDFVTIEYTGTIKGLDTTSITIIAIYDNEYHDDPEPEPEPEPDPTPDPVIMPQSDDYTLDENVIVTVDDTDTPVQPTVYGTVTCSTGNTVTMTTDDGGVVTFEIDDDTIVNSSLDSGTRIAVQLSPSGNGNIRLADVVTDA